MIEVKTNSPAAEMLPGPDTTTKRDATLSTDPRLKAMLKEAARVGWPKAFQNDLYQHDRAILEDHPAEPLLWILRDNGTHLLPLNCDTQGQASYARTVIDYHSGEDTLNIITDKADRPRYYLVTASGIVKTTSKEAGTSVKVKPKQSPSDVSLD